MLVHRNERSGVFMGKPRLTNTIFEALHYLRVEERTPGCEYLDHEVPCGSRSARDPCCKLSENEAVQGSNAKAARHGC